MSTQALEITGEEPLAADGSALDALKGFYRALVMVPQAFVTAWWQLALLRGVMGMTIAGLLPSIAKLVRHSVDDSRSGKTLGYLQSAQFSGQVVGPLVGAQIGAHVGLHQVFFVTGLLLAMCAGLNQWVRSRAR